MIYCIGRRDKYDRAFAAGRVTKQGRHTAPDRRPYPGGWVWRTVAEARQFIAMNGLFATHEVYGVIADWDRDAVLGKGEQIRRLVRDAEVVRLT